MNLTTLVTGAGGSLGQAIIKSLMMSEYRPKIISCDMNPLSVWLYTTDKGYLVPRADDKNYLSRMVDICRKEKVGFLFIGTVEEQLPLSEKREAFKELSGTEVICIDPRIQKICNDKLATAMLLKENDLPFPETVINDSVQIEKLINQQGFPLFLKLREGSGSKQAQKINNYEELNFYRNKAPNCILQEYLYPDDQEYTIGVFSDGKGTIISICLKRDLCGTGLTNTAMLAEDDEIARLCRKLAEILNFVGSINVQLRKTEKGICVFEINPRYSSTTAMRAHFGFRDVEWLLDTYLNPGKKIAYHPNSGIIAVRYWEEYYIDNDSYKRMLDNRGADEKPFI